MAGDGEANLAADLKLLSDEELEEYIMWVWKHKYTLEVKSLSDLELKEDQLCEEERFEEQEEILWRWERRLANKSELTVLATQERERVAAILKKEQTTNKLELIYKERSERKRSRRDFAANPKVLSDEQLVERLREQKQLLSALGRADMHPVKSQASANLQAIRKERRERELNSEQSRPSKRRRHEMADVPPDRDPEHVSLAEASQSFLDAARGKLDAWQVSSGLEGMTFDEMDKLNSCFLAMAELLEKQKEIERKKDAALLQDLEAGGYAKVGTLEEKKAKLPEHAAPERAA